MNIMRHDVLGTSYKVVFGDREALEMCEENVGECRIYSKEILVCNEKGDCSEKELKTKVSEIVAHEIFHAYANEAGLDLDSDTEEMIATFFMKNWRKMNNSILNILDESGYLTE